MLDISPEKGEHLDESIIEKKEIYNVNKKTDFLLFTSKNYVKNLNKDITEQTKNFESSIISSKSNESELEKLKRDINRLKEKKKELEEEITECKYSHFLNCWNFPSLYSIITLITKSLMSNTLRSV
jgi:predicted  nucleic acid-binding Zn-ribbon protein